MRPELYFSFSLKAQSVAVMDKTEAPYREPRSLRQDLGAGLAGHGASKSVVLK
jgi:hypothetical protein